MVVTDDLITPPEIEPLALDEVKRALRWTSTREDTLLAMWITAARQHFEEATGRQLITATYARRMDALPSVLELPRPPLQAVDVITVGGTELDAASYTVDAPRGLYAARGRVVPVDTWPTTTGSLGVEVLYRAGYGDGPEDIPDLIRAALIFLVGHYHKFRAEVYEADRQGALIALPIGAVTIMRSFRDSAIPIHGNPIFTQAVRTSSTPWA